MAGGINRYVATIMVGSFYEMWSAGTICDNLGGSSYCKVILQWDMRHSIPRLLLIDPGVTILDSR